MAELGDNPPNIESLNDMQYMFLRALQELHAPNIDSISNWVRTEAELQQIDNGTIITNLYMAADALLNKGMVEMRPSSIPGSPGRTRARTAFVITDAGKKAVEDYLKKELRTRNN